MYEAFWFLAGLALGLMVKVSFAPSNVQTRVSESPKTVTLPLSRGKVDWNALPKPSTANRPSRIK